MLAATLANPVDLFKLAVVGVIALACWGWVVVILAVATGGGKALDKENEDDTD